jgi:hypothetical protein
MTVHPPRERGATIWLTAPSGAGADALAEALAARLRALGRRAEALDRGAARVGLVGRLLARNGVLAVACADGVEVSPEPCARHELRVSLRDLSLDACVERVMATLHERDTTPA